MNRRTALGLAALVAAGSHAQSKKKAAPGPKKRKPIKHDSSLANNYYWANTADQYRAQMLALNVLLLHHDIRQDFFKYSDPTILDPVHPFNSVDPRIYNNLWKYCNADKTTAEMRFQAMAREMFAWANVGLNGVVGLRYGKKLDAPYTNPDECPCTDYDVNDPDCPVVDPLL